MGTLTSAAAPSTFIIEGVTVRITRLALLAALGLPLACGPESDPTASTSQRPPDGRSTGDLASPNGSLRVNFILQEMVAPAAPLLVSIDGRQPDPIWFPIEEKRYDLPPGQHVIDVRLGQSSCSVNRAADTDAPTNALDHVLILEHAVVNYVIDVDCSSVLDTWAIRVTTLSPGTDPDGLELTMWSPDFGTRQYHLPGEGVVRLGPTHVGWWKFRVDGVGAGCRVLGHGAPGWPDDSTEISPHSGMIFYWINCD